MAPPPLPSAPPTALPDEIIEQILLRFPPGEPASLFRAALVCKPWCRLISGPHFRRSFRELHRTPPMLGIFCNRGFDSVPHFVPMTTFRPLHVGHGHRRVIDARHSRVLLYEENHAFVVWDPITDQKWKVCFPPQCTRVFSWNAAVLCSVAVGTTGGDHLDFHRRPFIVVFVAYVPKCADTAVTDIYTYSSNAAAWSEPTCSEHRRYLIDPRARSTLVGNSLYFANISGNAILKYNMQLRQMSWIQLPSSVPHCRIFGLTTTEDGGLQLSIESEENLYTWSIKDADEVDARWEQNRVIELNTLLLDYADFTSLFVVGSTDDLGTIFVFADKVLYAIDLKTDKVKKLYEGIVGTIIPYMSLYTPELKVACTGEETSEGCSNA